MTVQAPNSERLAEIPAALVSDTDRQVEGIFEFVDGLTHPNSGKKLPAINTGALAQSTSRYETMISLAFIQEQLHAVPFVPFVVVLSSGDRYNVKTADHADLPPVDEQSGERPP